VRLWSRHGACCTNGQTRRVRGRGKAAEDCRSPRCWRAVKGPTNWRSFWDCGSLLPLFDGCCFVRSIRKVSATRPHLDLYGWLVRREAARTIGTVKAAIPVHRIPAKPAWCQEVILRWRSHSAIVSLVGFSCHARKALTWSRRRIQAPPLTMEATSNSSPSQIASRVFI
jgi:hypothetical protein